MNFLNKSPLLISVMSLCAGLAHADVLFTDNFEDNNTDGWILNGNIVTSATQAIGTYSMRLKKAGNATYVLDTSGYSGVSVSMNLAATALEGGEYCYAEVSADGGVQWDAIVTLTDGQDNGVFSQGQLTDSGMDDNSNLQLRFRNTGNALGDYCWGDEVYVNGTPGGVTPTPEIDAVTDLGFGTVTTDTSSTQSLTISNLGTADLVLGTITAPASPFSVQQDNCSSQTLTPSSSCSVDVIFSPITDGFYSDSLTVVSNDSDENPLVVNITGTGSTQSSSSDFDPLMGNGNVSRTELTYSTLMTGSDPGTLVDMSAFGVPANAAPSSHHFEGYLTLNGEATGGSFDEVKDTFRYTGVADTTRKHLPEFDYRFIQTGSHLIPVDRGMLINTHPEWEYILEPGRVWSENGDTGYSRAALPFSLQQKNANCIHNGVMSFLFDDSGVVSKVAYQISSETCLYFKFDMWGLLDATYSQESITGAAQIEADYQNEVNNRLPVKPISALSIDYPGSTPSVFGSEIDPNHMSVYGLLIDGTNYVGGCNTRNGAYPFCDVLTVPSYSTAKSNFAGVAMMRLQQVYGDTVGQNVGPLISDCAIDGNWNDVTIENAVDMATGNYGLVSYMGDEGASHTNDLFLSEDHASKINYACTQYSRKATPGTQWIYHTSDTYIAGTAMNAYLRQKAGSSQDVFDNIILDDIWKPLNISKSAQSTRRTYDIAAQPFTGWGLAYHHDDVAKLAAFLLVDEGKIGGQAILDPTELAAAMQQTPSDRGLTPKTDYKYKNGIWARDVAQTITECGETYIPFMSGYGGITVAMLPNNTVYYYFSDNDTFDWLTSISESHNIRSFCN